MECRLTGPKKEGNRISAFATKDGTQIYYKDWGTGRPVVFSHGWPLNSDSWEGQMLFRASHGYRCIAHDRRGHGRSSQPWDGSEMNTYADDLAALIESHDLRIEVFDGIRAASAANRSQFYKDLASGPFFGFNRPGTNVSQGLVDWFWMQGMLAGHKNTYDCIKAFSETDFTEDLKQFDFPTLVVHGDDDQIVPIDAAGRASAKPIRKSVLKVYAGVPHGLTDTHKDQLNADLLALCQGAETRKQDHLATGPANKLTV